MAITNRTAIRDDLSNQFDDSANAGANPGGLRLWTGAGATGTEIVNFDFNATAFGVSSTGVITLAGVPITGTAGAAGTAISFDIVADLIGTPVVLLDGLVGSPAGGDLNMPNNIIANAQDVDLTSLTYTTPAT